MPASFQVPEWDWDQDWEWVVGNVFVLHYFKEQSVTVSCSSSVETAFQVRICLLSHFLCVQLAGEGNSKIQMLFKL